MLKESYINLFPEDVKERERYVDEVFNLLQKTYERIGGLKGKGFKSPQDMIENIYLWKLNRVDGKIVAAFMYKDRNGRKVAATGTDLSNIGREKYYNTKNEDLKLKRSYSETSKASLSVAMKSPYFSIDDVATYEEVKEILKGEQIRKPPSNDIELKRHPELKDYLYQRNINGEWITKALVGKSAIKENVKLNKAIKLLGTVLNKKIKLI